MSTINYDGLFETAAVRHLKDNFDENIDSIKLQQAFIEYHAKDIDFDHYYKISPVIIAGIDSLSEDQRDAQYSYIYLNTMEKCAKAIAKGGYEYAEKTYKNAFGILEEKYGKPQIARNIAGALKFRASKQKKED